MTSLDNLQQLRQMLALAETGNFRKAGTSLGISHAAISQTISKLEREYGYPLFYKADGLNIPTPQGERLIATARTVLSEAEKIQTEISLMKELGTFELVIGVDPILCDAFLPAILSELVNENPKLKCRVIITNWQEMEEQLFDKSIHLYLGIAHRRRPDGIHFKRLLIPPPIIACNKNHPLAKQKTPLFKDLLQYRALISFAPDWQKQPWVPEIEHFSASADQATKWLGDNFIESESMGVLKDIIIRTESVAVLPESLLKNELNDGTLVRLDVSDFPFVTEISAIIAYLENTTLSASSNAFLRATEKLIDEINKKDRKNKVDNTLINWPLTMSSNSQ